MLGEQKRSGDQTDVDAEIGDTVVRVDQNQSNRQRDEEQSLDEQ